MKIRAVVSSSTLIDFVLLVSMIWKAMDEFVEFEILERATSPSGDFDFGLWTNDEGATTSRAMFVSILLAGEENYRNSEYRAVTLYHVYDLSVSWGTENMIQVRLPIEIEASEFLAKEINVSGVTITYLAQDDRIVELALHP